MKNWLTHQLVKNQNIVLLLEVANEPVDQIAFEEGTFRDQWIDLLFFDLIADSIDQHRNFDCVELVDNRIHFRIFMMQNLLVNINNLIKLKDGQNIKVLVEEE